MSKTVERVTDNNVGNKNQKSCYSEGFKQHIRDTIERVRWDGVYLGAGDFVSLDDLRAICDYAEGLLGSVERLESRLAQVERERDALLDYLGDSTCAPCDICKHDVGSGVMGCKRIREIGIPCFEWSGVCTKNTEEG